MIKNFLTFAVSQEGGAQPGPALPALKAILIFAGAPIGLFALITFVVMISSTERKKSRSSLTHIE